MDLPKSTLSNHWRILREADDGQGPHQFEAHGVTQRVQYRGKVERCGVRLAHLRQAQQHGPCSSVLCDRGY